MKKKYLGKGGLVYTKKENEPIIIEDNDEDIVIEITVAPTITIINNMYYESDYSDGYMELAKAVHRGCSL